MGHGGSLSCDSSNCLYCHTHAMQPAAPDGSVRRGSLDSLGRAWGSDPNLPRLPHRSADFGSPTRANGHACVHCTSTWYQRASGVVLDAQPQQWQPRPSWDAAPAPIAASLVSLACFQVPVHHGRRDLICSVEFSDSGRLLATASVGKQVHVYRMHHGVGPGASQGDCLPCVSHRMPSKLSCLTWAPESENLVTVGDYDGGMYQLDVHTGHFLTDVDEHHGHRILAVAHSRDQRGLTATASEDGTVKLWCGATGAHESSATIALPQRASACGVDFGPSHTLAVAAADACVYLYDLRQCDAPMRTLRGHHRPASYARFLGPTTLVSAAVDDSLALWDLDGPCEEPVQRFTGHNNSRSFVGLSVCPSQQLLACGSESGDVYVYRTSWARPMASAAVQGAKVGLGGLAGSTQSLPDVVVGGAAAVPDCDRVQSYRGSGREFVSAVAWRPSRLGDPVLAAATSHGTIALMGLAAA